MLGIVLFGFSLYASYLYTGSLPDIGINRATELISDVSQTVTSWFRGVANTELSAVPDSDAPSAPVGIYRWKDANGVVHYGDQPPESELQSERLNDINPNTNLVRLPKPRWADPEEKKAREDASVMPNPYSAEGVQEIFDKAKNARDQMNRRNKRQQEILDKI